MGQPKRRTRVSILLILKYLVDSLSQNVPTVTFIFNVLILGIAELVYYTSPSQKQEVRNQVGLAFI